MPPSENTTESIWDIPDAAGTLSLAQERDYWADEHGRGYDILSLSHSPSVNDWLCDRIGAHLGGGDGSRILVAGCGTTTKLERAVAERFPELEIVCGDFADVIEIAQANFAEAAAGAPTNIRYETVDSTNIAQRDHYDLVITINSVLSSSHATNQKMMANFHAALKPRGMAIGFFPTIMALTDIESVTGKRHPEKIDPDRNAFFEEAQGVEQILYSPMRFRQLAVSTGFALERMEIYFFDHPDIAPLVKKYYAEFTTDDQDVVLYELYVELAKPVA